MIQFIHVSKYYDHHTPVLNDVSFFIDQGEFVFLTGASGAGKTTLLKHIYMEEKPTTGQVLVSGYDSHNFRDKDKPYLRRKLGIVFQDFRLLHDRNVFENVSFAMRVTGAPDYRVKKRVFEVLVHTGISHRCAHFPDQLSGGEQQRVCIARALINDPYILLADEPTGNLDFEISLEIMRLLQTINSWGTTVIMATHDIHLIEPYHYRTLMLEHGTLVGGSDSMIKPKSWSMHL